MNSEAVRKGLLAKIAVTWPRYKENAELASRIESASVSELRRHLAWAELMASTDTLSPRYSQAERDGFRELRIQGAKQGRGYTLAKDECSWYSGPSWVPFNLWMQADNELSNSSFVVTCARTLIEAPGAEKLWSDLAARYDRPDNIATTLPAVCAAAHESWRVMPRDKPRDFKKRRQELARKSEQLAKELETFYLSRDADDHEWPGLLDFTQLLDGGERERFDQAVRVIGWRIASRALRLTGKQPPTWGEYNEDDGGLMHSNARLDAHEIYALMIPDHVRPDMPYGGVPSLPDTLRRIARKFSEDSSRPPLQRPHFPNAERNFFARAICKYFWQSKADVSPAIVASVVSMFYEQGITENEISQMVAKLKSASRLAGNPESSPFT